MKKDEVAEQRCGKEARRRMRNGRIFHKNRRDPGLSLRPPIRLEGKKVLFLESP